ncbi:acyl--CoA ligase [bacterium]|nr:acyl--CoA ligase [bacterium]
MNTVNESYPPSLLYPVFDMLKNDPEREAMVFGRHRLSYGAMAAHAEALARQLSKMGVRPGHFVAVMLPPRPEAVISLLSVWLAGATWVGVNPRYHKDEQRHVLIDSGARVLISITSDGKRDYESDLVAHESEAGISVIRVGKSFWSQDLPGISGEVDLLPFWNASLADHLADIPAAVIYTSGSTGKPKGALITHEGLAYRSWTLFKDRFPVPHIRQMMDLPVNHIGAMASGIGLSFIAGGMMVLSDHFDPRMTLRTIETEQLDILSGVPTMLSKIVSDPLFAETDFSSIRYVNWGAGPISEKILNTLLEVTSAEFTQQYGMTETNGPICYTPPTRNPDILLNTTGKPDPRLDLRIANEDDQMVPAGEEGEVQVKMPCPFAGYLNNPEATEEAFTADGFLHTGDRAKIREDGYLVFCGRSKHMYKSGGFNVYPREVEMVLEAHPGIKSAGVIGVQDTTWGEIGHAFLEVHQMVDPDQVMNWCRQQMANYKVPKKITVIDALPRTTVDKIDYSLLKELHAKITST